MPVLAQQPPQPTKEDSNSQPDLPYNGAYQKSRVENGLIADEDTRAKILELINCARHTIYFSTRLEKDFFEKIDVQTAYIRATTRGVHIRMLIEPTINWDTKINETGLTWLKGLKTDGYKFEVRQSREKIPHWIIVDKNHIRIEKTHKDTDKTVSNSIYFNLKTQSTAQRELFLKGTLAIFDDWWYDSDPV